MALDNCEIELTVQQNGDVVPSGPLRSSAASSETPSASNGSGSSSSSAPIGWANGNGTSNGSSSRGGGASVVSAAAAAAAVLKAATNGGGKKAAKGVTANGAAANGAKKAGSSANGTGKESGNGFVLFRFGNGAGASGLPAALNGKAAAAALSAAAQKAGLIAPGALNGGSRGGLAGLGAAMNVVGAVSKARAVRWLIQESEFAPGVVGCKARNLVALRRRLPDWVLVPRRCVWVCGCGCWCGCLDVALSVGVAMPVIEAAAVSYIWSPESNLPPPFHKPSTPPHHHHTTPPRQRGTPLRLPRSRPRGPRQLGDPREAQGGRLPGGSLGDRGAAGRPAEGGAQPGGGGPAAAARHARRRARRPAGGGADP